MNDAWRVAPWADVLYAADGKWWRHHEGVPGFTGEKWTQDDGPDGLARSPRGSSAADRFGLIVVHSQAGRGVSFDPAAVNTGKNSGFQALNLAVLFGARRIVLLGFDMQRTGGRAHFFGDHPGRLQKGQGFEAWLGKFAQAAPQLSEAGIEVINATRETALECFPRVPVEAL